MKHILTLLTLAAIGLPGVSQEPQPFSSKANEFNIGFFNAFALNQIDELGIGYKRRFKSGAIRTGTGFNFWKSQYDDDINQYDRKSMEISPKLGYEFDRYFNRIRLQYGADFVASFSKLRGELTSQNINQANINETKEYSLGLRPVLGITVYLNESISISTETYFYFQYTNLKEEQSSGTNISSITDKGISTGLGPLGIFSVNFHF